MQSRLSETASSSASQIEPYPTETMETYTYKLALEWRVNLNHVIVLHSNLLSPKYINLVELVGTLLNPETSIDAVCDYLNRRTGKKWDNIVVSILIYLLAKKLEVENLTQLGSSGASASVAELLVRINEFARRRNLTLYDRSSAEHARLAYIRELDVSLSITAEKVRLLAETQARYAEVMKADLLRLSQLEIFNEMLYFIIEGNLTREDTLTIFDNARISKTLQHVVCYSNITYQKVYKPGPFDLPVRRAAIINNLTSHPPNGVLLFTISLSQVYQVRYTIESGIMETSVRIRDKDDLISAIAAGFPMLKFTVRTREMETRINLYPTQENTFDLPFHFLLHRTVVQPHLFQFYMNESTSSAPEKNIFTFRHKPFWELPGMKGTGHGTGDKDESTFTLSTPRMANGTNYINLTITAGSESSCLRTLALLIPAICIFYEEDVLGVSPFFEQYNIPGLVARSHKPGSKLRKELSQKWPEVFTPAYLAAKETTTKSLVRVTTDPDEALRWESEVIMHELTNYDREVLPFPRFAEGDDIMFWFTSSSPEARRIGYRTNDYDDSPKYPLVPFSSVKGEVQKIKGLSGGNVVSLAAQGPDLDAEAPDTINHILGFEARRKGVVFGPNSVIRALLDASDQVRGGLPTSSEKEVQAIRKILAEQYEPELYKQQLYDLTNDEITQKLEEQGEYFDPLIYNAGLEAVFGIDIYYIKARIVQNVRTMTLELPRYSHFYCSNRQKRNCILIFINTGVRADNLRWPHCELIVRKSTGSALMGPRMSARLAQIRDRCHKFLVCTPGTVYDGQYMSSAMNEVLRSPSIVAVVSQYVDPNGKARAFTVRDRDEQLVTIFCYPCAPMSLPHSSNVHAALDREWIERLCDDVASERSSEGLWCKHRETAEVLYVRVAVVPSDVPLTGIDPLTSVSGIDDASRFASEISAQDRLAIVLKDVLIWALDVSGLSATKFIRRYLTYMAPEEGEGESEDDRQGMELEQDYYDISTIGRRLPPVKNMNEVFSYLDTAIPIVDGRFVLHNKAYYKSAVYFLKGHPFTSYDPDESRFIKDYYRSAGDFRNDKRAIILTGDVDPLATAVDNLSKYMIVDHISTIGNLPIFYQQDGVLWIVQGTHFKEMKCAYNVCAGWREKKVNTGYNTLPVKKITVDVLLYSVSVGRIVLSRRLAGTTGYENEKPYEVLQLGESNFAALLRASDHIAM